MAEPPPAARTDAVEAVNDSGLHAFTGYRMKRAFSLVQADLHTALAPLGLRMVSFSALIIVADNPGITQSRLAQTLAIERSNIVVVIDALEQAGLLTRKQVPHNRRAHALRATLAGLRMRDKACRAVEAHESRCFAALTEAEHDALRSALARLLAGPDSG